MMPQQSNFPLNPNQPSNMHPQQLNQMMGNMSMQSPPTSMGQAIQHQQPQHQQQPQLGPGMQITQPMTYLQQQNDSSQNMIYQQR